MRETTMSAVHASPMVAIRRMIGARWLRTYAVAAAIAVLLTFTGANGTESFAFALRLAYWLILMLAGTLIANITGYYLDRLSELKLWQEIAVMIVIITPLITLLAWLATALLSGYMPQWRQWPGFLLPVAVISTLMAVLHTQINTMPAQSHAFVEPQGTSEPGAAFRARLPFKYQRADIYALAAEDHYLRVYSSAGEVLVLMRLYDAIRELDGIEGSQTHRSWWVAKKAVTSALRRNGKAELTLKSGLCVPVSRSYHKALKADGWL